MDVFKKFGSWFVLWNWFLSEIYKSGSHETVFESVSMNMEEQNTAFFPFIFQFYF